MEEGGRSSDKNVSNGPFLISLNMYKRKSTNICVEKKFKPILAQKVCFSAFNGPLKIGGPRLQPTLPMR